MAAVFAVCPLEMPESQKIKTPAPIHKLSGLGPVLPLSGCIKPAEQKLSCLQGSWRAEGSPWYCLVTWGSSAAVP